MDVNWVLLALGIVLEVAGTTCMKLSHGLTRPWPTLFMFALYGLSLAMLALALRGIELSLGYAIWSAPGTVFIVTIGIAFFGEPVTASRVFWLLITLGAIIGLRIA